MAKRLALSTLGVLFAAVALVIGLALSKPDTYRVEREIEIAAAPAIIFANLDDLRQWEKWSPWEQREASVKKTFGGPPHGVGASYAWEGAEAGAGKMTVVESSPAYKVEIRLEFLRPLTETNRITFDLTPLPAATRVRWTMTGPTRFAAKLLTVFTSMDALIGRDFDAGLTRLRKLSEEQAAH